MATVFTTGCTTSADWDGQIVDASCAMTFNTPTAGRMRSVVDSATNDSAYTRKLSGTSCTNYTLAIKGLKLVQHGGAAGVSAAIICQLQDGFTTYAEVQIDSARGLFCRNIAGSQIHNATINGADVIMTVGTEYDLLLQASVNNYFRYWIGPTGGSMTQIQNSTGLSGGAALNLERIAAGIIAAPTGAWTGTDMIVEMDEITWTDGAADDPYGMLGSAPLNLVGTSAGTSSSTGTILLTQLLNGASAGTSTSVGVISQDDYTLVGVSSSTSTSIGTITLTTPAPGPGPSIPDQNIGVRNPRVTFKRGRRSWF